MKTRLLWRWSPSERKLRLSRTVWTKGKVGDGKGYSAKATLALRPWLFRFRRESDGWFVCLFGVEYHYQRAYGGIFTP